MEAKPEWVDGFFNDVKEENQKLVSKIQQENRAAMQQLSNQIKEVRDEQAVQKGEIKEFQNEVKDLKKGRSPPVQGSSESTEKIICARRDYHYRISSL